MTTNAERVAEIIYSHMSSWDDEAQAVNATQDLAEADLLKPDLPAPAYEGSTTWYVPGKNEWSTDTYKDQVMLEVDIEEPGNFGPSTVTKTWFMPRDEARALIMALLAALSHVEQEQNV